MSKEKLKKDNKIYKAVVSAKRKKFIQSLMSDAVEENIQYNVFRTNRKYARMNRKFRRFKKKKNNKKLKVSNYNIKLLYYLAYGLKFDKENFKRVLILYKTYWINNSKRISSLKSVKHWLNKIDFDSNMMILWHITKDKEFKRMLLEKSVKPTAVFKFDDTDRKERMLKDFCNLLSKEYRGY